MRQLVAHREQEPMGQPPRLGPLAAREPLRAKATGHDRGDQQDDPDAAGDQQHLRRQRCSGEGDEGGERDGADETVQPDAGQRRHPAHTHAGQAAEPPGIRAHMPRGEQPEQLGLGIGPHVPPAGQGLGGQCAPAQRAQQVLADHPREQTQQRGPRTDVGQPGQRHRRHRDRDEHPDDEHGPGVQHDLHARTQWTPLSPDSLGAIMPGREGSRAGSGH